MIMRQLAVLDLQGVMAKSRVSLTIIQAPFGGVEGSRKMVEVMVTKNNRGRIELMKDEEWADQGTVILCEP